MADRDCDNRFLYSPISKASQEIRLLQFKNVPFELTNFEHSPLECCMTPVPLIDAPSYRTLSYVWGVDGRCKPLLVNGNLMYVTKSLDSALRHLMLFPNLLEDCIWIDAVSIDQADLDEKAWQVSMMKDIYLNAKSSIGWVGLADDASRLTLKTVWEYQLYRAFVQEFEVIKDCSENFLQRIAEDIVLAPTKGDLRRGEAIRSFLGRQFFARIWIHQEIMAAKHIDLVCGTNICDWDSLHICTMAMAVYSAGLRTEVFDMSIIQRAVTIGPNGVTPGPKVFQLRHFFTQDHLAYNLWPLVVLTRASGAESSEPRDSIYGLLSVAADSTELQVSAMYKTPVEECFIQAAKAFLEHGYLEVLTACQQPRSLVSLPSWVPDFSTRWHDDFNTVTAIESMSKSREDTAYRSLFCVSKGSSRGLRFEERGQRQLLHLAGIRFDSVKRTARTLTREAVHTLMPFMDTDAVQDQDTQLRSARIVEAHGLGRIIDATLKQVKEISDLLESTDSNSSNSIETMLRVLTKDIEYRKLPGHHIMHRLPPATLRQYVQSVSLLQRYGLETLFLAPGNIWLDLSILPYMILYRNAERRAFITSNGYLGIGPGTLQEEDIVAIIYGTEVPLLLRPCDGGVYKLLGEAYVDGIMDGEAMEGRKEEVVFVLV